MTASNPSFALQASNVRFPVPPGAGYTTLVPPAPRSPVADGLGNLAGSASERQALVCFAILDTAAQKNARREAENLFPQMLGNTQLMMAFGNDAVAELNALARKLVHDIEPVDIPELASLMDNLRRDMRRIKNQWDVGNPQVEKKVRDWATKGRSFWGKAKSLIEVLMEDAMAIEQQLDKVVAGLQSKKHQLVRNVGFYDTVYATNEREVLDLVYAIAVMEQIAVVANLAARQIKADPDNPADRTKIEQKRLITELAENTNIRAAEFKNRLFVGWATSPQTTNMRTLDVGLAAKIDLLINLTIPTMLLTIAQWRMLIQALQGADMEKVVAATANEWLTAYAQAGAQGVSMIAEAVETPTLRPDTIATMAELVASQADAILEARKLGAAMRLEVSQAITAGYKVLAAAQTRLNDAVVDDIVTRAQDLVAQINDANPEAEQVATAPAA